MTFTWDHTLDGLWVVEHDNYRTGPFASKAHARTFFLHEFDIKLAEPEVVHNDTTTATDSQTHG